MKTCTEDNILVEGCLKNDRESQHLLYNKFSPKMLALCMRFTQDKTEAEDLMIEGFMIVFTTMNSYKRNSSLETWIHAIMVKHAISAYRKNAKYWNMEELEENIMSIQDSSLGDIPASISEKEIMRFIQEMPTHLRYTLNLIAFEGFSYKEAANELNINEGTVRSRFSKAKSWLSQRILS